IPITRMDHHVIDADMGQPRHERLPTLARIQRDKEAELSARVEQARILEILLDDPHVAERRKVACDGCPRAAEVSCRVDIRPHVTGPSSWQSDTLPITPKICWRFGSICLVKSGLIVQLFPRSTDLNSLLPPI